MSCKNLEYYSLPRKNFACPQETLIVDASHLFPSKWHPHKEGFFHLLQYIMHVWFHSCLSEIYEMTSNCMVRCPPFIMKYQVTII